MRPLDRFADLALWLTAALGTLALAGTAIMLVLGVRPVIVRSGSMGDAYPMRSVAIVQRVDSDEIRAGDVLLADRGDARVLHRAVSIGSGGAVTLKGDANRRPDSEPYVLRDTELRAVGHIPMIGAIGLWLRGPAAGFALALLVLAPMLLAGRGRAASRVPEVARA